MTKLPSEITNRPSEMTKLPSEITKLPLEMAKLLSEITKLPSEIANLPSEMTKLLSEIAKLPPEMIKLPNEYKSPLRGGSVRRMYTELQTFISIKRKTFETYFLIHVEIDVSLKFEKLKYRPLINEKRLSSTETMSKTFDMSILVSIITPSFNCCKYINTTIESVINQDYTNWELIIVDDCSTDNSAEIIKHYTKLDQRIKAVFLSSNQGAAVARNAGMVISQGRYIAFLDSDDVWLPNKLAVQLDFMRNSGAPISFTEYDVYDEELLNCQHRIKVPLQIDYSGYLKTTIIGMSTAIIDTEKIGSFSFYNIRTRQDTYLWITLLKKGFIAYGINEPLTKYRIRKDSISANKIKAARQVWHLYYDLEMMSFVRAFYFFINYGLNSVKKRFA